MNESTHGSISGKLMFIVFLIVCAGMIVMGILGSTAPNLGPSSQTPTAALTSRPANVPASTTARVTMSRRASA